MPVRKNALFMISARTLLGFLLLLSFAAQAQDSTPEDRRRLVEQKMRLVEMLVSTQAGKASSERLERSTAALSQAKQALTENRLDDAAGILDAALRTSAPAPGASKSSALSQEALRSAYQNLVEQVATYRASVEDLATHPRLGSAARVLITRIDGKSAEARKLVAAGNQEAANRTLGEAYQLAVGELAKMRAGDEVVLSLNFASPAEEFAYETRRFESSEMMATMLLKEGKAEGDRRQSVDAFLAEGKRLRGDADGLARSGRHKEAVGVMEKAVAQLTRALQAMGVPVF